MKAVFEQRFLRAVPGKASGVEHVRLVFDARRRAGGTGNVNIAVAERQIHCTGCIVKDFADEPAIARTEQQHLDAVGATPLDEPLDEASNHRACIVATERVSIGEAEPALRLFEQERVMELSCEEIAKDDAFRQVTAVFCERCACGFGEHLSRRRNEPGIAA